MSAPPVSNQNICVLQRHYGQLKEEFAKLKPLKSSEDSANKTNNNNSHSQARVSDVSAQPSLEKHSSSNTSSSVVQASSTAPTLASLGVFSSHEAETDILTDYVPGLSTNVFSSYPGGLVGGLQNHIPDTGTLSDHIASVTLGPEEASIELPDGL